MGQVAARIIDATESRAFDCVLPDDVPVSDLSCQVADLLGFPTYGFDNFPLDYGFILKGASALDSSLTLADAELSDRCVLRLVPEITAGQEEVSVEDNEKIDIESSSWESRISVGDEHILLDKTGTDIRADVRIDARVHREIEEFARQDRRCECAGLLLGTVDVEAGLRVIHIRAMSPAVGAESSRTSVKFTLAAWEHMYRVRERDYPDFRVLGWFHTHAGWGVFMSDSDVFIHRHFFSHPNMLAYVLDPTSIRDGFFYWHGGRVGLCPSYGLVGTPEDVASRHDGRIGRNRRPDIRDGMIVVLALVVLGQAIWGRTPLKNVSLRKPVPSASSGRVHSKSVRIRLAQEPNVRIYVLGRGENLWSVCDREYGNGGLADALARYNGLRSFTGLQVGQRLELPPKEVLTRDRRW